MTATERVVDALTAAGMRPRVTGPGQVIARCPAHDDRNPSLSVSSADGRALLYCHAGCDTDAVTHALGLTPRDLFDDNDTPTVTVTGPTVTHTYRDTDGRPVFVVKRTGTGSGKRVTQARVNPDGTTTPRLGDVPRVLYRLPELVTALDAGVTAAFVVEGEKDADALAPLVHPYPVTTSPMGAGKWTKADPAARDLLARFPRVVVLADDDTPGHRHAHDVTADLTARGTASVDAYVITGHHDVGDAIAAGHVTDATTLRDSITPLDTAATTTDTDQGARLDVIRGDAIVMRPRRWVWPGLLPLGKLTVLDGDPGDGKSSITLDVAARVTRGLPMPDGYVSPHLGGPRDVVIVSPEDDPADTVGPRILGAGADMSRVHVVRGVTVPDGDSTTTRGLILRPGDVDHLATLVDAVHAAVVILDPLFAFVSVDADAYRDNVMRQALGPLVRLAEAADAAVLVVRHATKGTGGKAVHRGGGSVAITGVARSSLITARDPDDDTVRLLTSSKVNIGTAATWRYTLTDAFPDITDDLDPRYRIGRVEWLGTDERTANEVLRDADRGGDDDTTETDAVAAFLTDYLTQNGGEASAADATKAVRDVFGPVSKQTLMRARRGAGIVTGKAGMRSGWVWSLPTSDPEGSTTDPKVPYSQVRNLRGSDGTFGDATGPAPLPGTVTWAWGASPHDTDHACAGPACRVPGCGAAS